LYSIYKVIFVFFFLLIQYIMNFNCISPEGNGFNYNVRFDEPVIVPENASVSLNWAQFERDNSIRFTENQTITINAKKVLPFYDFHNNGNNRISVGGNDIWRINGGDRASDLTVEIVAGNYTLDSLMTEINKKLGESGIPNGRCLLRDNFPTPIATNNSLCLYDFDLIIPPKSVDASSLEMGFMVQNNHLPATYHATHRKDVDTTGDIGQVVNTSGATGSFTGTLPDAGCWNSYALGKSPYQHTGGHFDTYNQASATFQGAYQLNSYMGNFDELEHLNTILFTPNKNFGDQEGDIFVGLYSESYAGVNENGVGASHLGGQNDVQRTNGALIITKKNGGGTPPIPMAYCGFRLMGSVASLQHATPSSPTYIQFISAHNGDGTLNDNLTHAVVDFEMPLSSMLRNDEAYSIGIQTYFDRGAKFSYLHGTHRGDLHIRYFLMRQNGSKSVIYDTDTKFPHFSVVDGGVQNFGFTQGFMNTFQSDAMKAANTAGTLNLAQAMASGFPFNPIVCMTKDGEGGKLDYTQISLEADGIATHGNKTNTHLLDYSMTLSKELANLVVNTNTPFELAEKSASYLDYGGAVLYMTNLYGSFSQIQSKNSEFFYLYNLINSPAAKDKYSIILNNLPIKGYKNTNDKNRSGYRKPILASIPAPYNEKYLENNGDIVGSYQASLGIINALSNQAITTNNFDILILDMETDKPAEQLTKSIINFTIQAE